MRLLHTGDWHLGKRLYGADRGVEAGRRWRRSPASPRRRRSTPCWSAATCSTGGWSTRRRSAPACAALERLAETAPVLAVAGNHDDPDLWTHLAPLPRGLGASTWPGHVRPAPRRSSRCPRRPGRCTPPCCRGPTRRGSPLDAGASVQVRPRPATPTWWRRDLDYAAEAGPGGGPRGAPRCSSGHLMVERARAGGGERELTMGITYAVSSAGAAARPRLPRAGARAPAPGAPGRRGAGPLLRQPDGPRLQRGQPRRSPRGGGGGRRPRDDAPGGARRPPGPWCACAAPRRPGRPRLGAPGRVVRVRGRARRPGHRRVHPALREAVPGALRSSRSTPQGCRSASAGGGRWRRGGAS